MDYHKDTTKISKSGLDLINKSPLHYWDRYFNPNAQEKKTAALTFGSAVHTKILEPSEFDKKYAIAPTIDRRTKDGKSKWDDFVSAHTNHEIITSDDYALIERINEAVLDHHQSSLLLSKLTTVEEVFTHEDMKCKPDGITSLNIVLDLKTTEDASPYAFGRSALKYRYDVQAAFYTDILEANGLTVEGFVFIAVEKTAPFAVAVYVIEDEDINKGREKYLENLKVWRECKDTGKWPGYGMGKLMLPNYGK
jgi:exodeoxyribonuclease VIII